MNQQEIKANLPQLPLQNNDNEYIGEYGISWDKTQVSISDYAFQKATFTAINNTYGKNINPESVPDMYNALQTIDEILHAETMGEVSKIIRDILKNATL
jgi:hypothetical protein